MAVRSLFALVGVARDVVPNIRWVTPAEIQFDWHFVETQLVAEFAEQVALVRFRDQNGIIDEQHDGWRLDADLSGVVDLRLPVASGRRCILTDRFSKHAI